MVKIDKKGNKYGNINKNEHKNEQIYYCNLGVFTLYLGQNKGKSKPTTN